MRKQPNYVAKMLSTDSSVSNMRVLVTFCIVNAIFLSQVMTAMWALSLMGVIVKPVDFTPMTYLVGLFVSSLTFKAVQSFSRNDVGSDGEEITVRGDSGESE